MTVEEAMRQREQREVAAAMQKQCEDRSGSKGRPAGKKNGDAGRRQKSGHGFPSKVATEGNSLVPWFVPWRE
ncbi:hypothetical protein [Mesorhizobium sp. M0276]|uniref:hypothetical protein n=1 Tax=Mesorhizobium sp. M0276 TaxID=2956928 RepID=UPI0033358AEE